MRPAASVLTLLLLRCRCARIPAPTGPSPVYRRPATGPRSPIVSDPPDNGVPYGNPSSFKSLAAFFTFLAHQDAPYEPR